MNVTLNGEARAIDEPMSVEGLLAHIGVRQDVVVVERNREIVPRADFAETMLIDGDSIEVVRFMCGG